MFDESYQQIVNIFNVIDRKLVSPEEVADKVEKKYMKQKLTVMKRIFDITLNYIVDNDGIIPCPQNADLNSDQVINILDVVMLINQIVD